MDRNKELGYGLAKLAILVFAINNSSFMIQNSAWADSFKCGVEAVNKVAAAKVKGPDALREAVDAIKEDDFDEDADRDAAFEKVYSALMKGEGWSSAGEFLYCTAAGIQPGFKGGWDNFELAPVPDKRLKFVEAEKDIPQGKIKSAWKYEDGKCVWRFTIPEGTKATVCVNGMCKPHKPGQYEIVISEE